MVSSTNVYISLCATLSFALVQGLPQHAAISPDSHPATPCETFDFKIPVQASNDSGVLLPAAIYNISGSYCPPTTIIPHREHTVQLLIHGATANKHYWSALGPVGGGYQERNYSWIDVSRAQGYHTVAIDRLGVGNSSHPSPGDVRLPLDADITSQIVHQLREKPLPVSHTPGRPRQKPFKKVILVGHSIASVIINYLINNEPDVADAVVLTGYVHVFTKLATSGQQFASAASIFPRRFPGLDAGYQSIVSAENMRVSFFSDDGSFDPVIPTLNWQREDVQGTGEVQSLGSLLGSSFATDTAENFRAPIAIVIGEFDEPLCNSNCHEGNSNLAVMSKSYYPHSRAFEPIVIPGTGHFLNLHYTAKQTFSRVHNWLEKVGF
ncbi:Alpha/Beta hydrolase protein [Xylogone sp. PMI_703]|nr:Alpha/Beta hydrolase protein [Xylogone sp. PMI_703]